MSRIHLTIILLYIYFGRPSRGIKVSVKKGFFSLILHKILFSSTSEASTDDTINFETLTTLFNKKNISGIGSLTVSLNGNGVISHAKYRFPGSSSPYTLIAYRCIYLSLICRNIFADGHHLVGPTRIYYASYRYKLRSLLISSRSPSNCSA